MEAGGGEAEGHSQGQPELQKPCEKFLNQTNNSIRKEDSPLPWLLLTNTLGTECWLLGATLPPAGALQQSALHDWAPGGPRNDCKTAGAQEAPGEAGATLGEGALQMARVQQRHPQNSSSASL